MAFVGPKEIKPLAAVLATCGGTGGPLFGIAKELSKHPKGAELDKIIPEALWRELTESLGELEDVAVDGQITGASILKRFGSGRHFREMFRQARAKMASVAGEIPARVRPIAHTLLPLTDGAYKNGAVLIKFKGLVPLGPQKGNLVVHLSGVFSCGSNEEIKSLLGSQAADPKFMELARKIETLDYESTILQKLTISAKKQLEL